MNVKNDILEELRSVSAVVATIGRQTPYEVPEGYFAELPAGVMRKIGEWEEAKSLKFSVPEGYFEGFAQQVLNRIKGEVGDNVGPAGQAASGLGSDTLPAVLVQAGRRTPYQVPEAYFETLAPILAVVKDKNPYLVPEGYFEQLPAEVMDKTAGGKVLSLGIEENRLGVEEKSRLQVVGVRRMSWWKYSAAAVVAGLVLTAGWMGWNGSFGHHVNKQTPAEIAKTISKVPDQELKSWLADQDTTLAQPVGNLAATANVDMGDSDMKDLLGNVSDGELKQYMEEHGEATDMATN